MNSQSNIQKPYKIGPRFTASLVAISRIKVHLNLLHAFAGLKTRVKRLEGHGLQAIPEGEDQRWAWFVGLAVERFELWCKWTHDKTLDLQSLLALHLPPIDVVMVWHSYCLNPAWYQEDIKRVHSLRFLQNFSRLFEKHYDEITEYLLSSPLETRVNEWIRGTQLPFDPIESTNFLVTKSITCPRCRTVLNVELMKDEGTGYLQANFVAKCTSRFQCPEITKSSLAARKLARDISTNGTCNSMKFYQTYIAGTFYRPKDPYDYARARNIKDRILQANTLLDPERRRQHPPKLHNPMKDTYAYTVKPTQREWELAILKRVKFSLESLLHEIRQPFSGAGRRVEPLFSRIKSAYTDDKPWSIDLVGAVLRQGSFIKKMEDLCWTGSSFFDEVKGNQILQHAVKRYHGFLDLLHGNPSSFFVPTVDIDLVWHTHQLTGSKYEKDCREFLRRFLDHNDNVGRLHLASGFQRTCKAWEKRFNVPYAQLSDSSSSIAEPAPSIEFPEGDPTKKKEDRKCDWAEMIEPIPDLVDSLRALSAANHHSTSCVVGDGGACASCGGGGGGGCGGWWLWRRWLRRLWRLVVLRYAIS
ncbi:hypothetical protein Moror_6144 [Moniliophthora roreri MCA 2997]|uniref:Uncharacterized protein n=1 Tax=Moniliophthora roreri (strain MCA 2997) TaxID=1381753 RepID=V2WWD7_MONRO|nr:hypothetical protein Moror_6144 [Moniliophthora roreri MCA 2997]